MATIFRQPQHHPGDVITEPRDVIGDLLQDDSLLQTSFYDVTDTSQLLQLVDAPWIMTSFQADDSGVFLNDNNDDHWSPGIPPQSRGTYDVIAEHVTAGATRASVARHPRYDVIEHVDFMGTADAISPSRDWSACGGVAAAGSARGGGDDVTARCEVRFSDEQIACICVALQQRRDVDRLESFLSTLASGQSSSSSSSSGRLYRISPSSRENCDPRDATARPSDAAAADALLSSAALVAFARGRYSEVVDVLRSHSFSEVHHGRLQQLWYDTHYAAASDARRRPLGAVDRYRVRRRHPLPTTISDGQHTVYCFKVRSHFFPSLQPLNPLQRFYDFFLNSRMLKEPTYFLKTLHYQM